MSRTATVIGFEWRNSSREPVQVKGCLGVSLFLGVRASQSCSEFRFGLVLFSSEFDWMVITFESIQSDRLKRLESWISRTILRAIPSHEAALTSSAMERDANASCPSRRFGGYHIRVDRLEKKRLWIGLRGRSRGRFRAWPRRQPWRRLLWKWTQRRDFFWFRGFLPSFTGFPGIFCIFCIFFPNFWPLRYRFPLRVELGVHPYTESLSLYYWLI